MNFQNIRPIKSMDVYIDDAFKKAARIRKQKFDSKNLFKIRNLYVKKISVVNSYFVDTFGVLLTSFPSISKLSSFYSELISITINSDELKKSLSSLSWIIDKTNSLSRDAVRKVLSCDVESKMDVHFKAYLGRMSSFKKQMDKNLDFLRRARFAFRDFPDISEESKIICIAGFPNVGKSTLLSKISNSKPEIKNYSFTTKKLNTGFLTGSYKRIQIIDTPGTLARFDKMNYIEKIAYLSIKYLADTVVFVFDPTFYYSFEDQKMLFDLVVDFGKPIVVYISKTDISSEENIGCVKNFCSSKDLTCFSDVKELFDFLK